MTTTLDFVLSSLPSVEDISGESFEVFDCSCPSFSFLQKQNKVRIRIKIIVEIIGYIQHFYVHLHEFDDYRKLFHLVLFDLLKIVHVDTCAFGESIHINIKCYLYNK